MNRKILAFATIATLAVPVASAANPEIRPYGYFDISLDHLNTGADTALNVSSNSSVLGVRGRHELDHGLHATFQVEQFVNFDTKGTQLATSDTFVGLGGGFGLVRVGKMNTPLKMLRARTELFPNQVGDARNITRTTPTTEGQWDERFNNSIHYLSPSLGGLVAELHFSTNYDYGHQQNQTDDNDNDAFGASLSYLSGPLYAAVAYEQANNIDGPDLSAIRIAAYADLGPFRITALAQRADADADRTDTAYGAGIRYALGNTNIKTQAYHLDADADDQNATLAVIGFDHRLGNNMILYANYAQMLNDDEQYLRPYTQARTASPTGGADGDTTNGLSLGAIYSF